MTIITISAVAAIAAAIYRSRRAAQAREASFDWSKARYTTNRFTRVQSGSAY